MQTHRRLFQTRDFCTVKEICDLILVSHDSDERFWGFLRDPGAVPPPHHGLLTPSVVVKEVCPGWVCGVVCPAGQRGRLLQQV